MDKSVAGGMWLAGAVALGLAVLVSSVAARAATDQGLSVYWSDADSGRLSDGTRFRLHGVDAPETGGVGARGGAQCEAERELGYNAKAVAVELTRGTGVRVAEEHGVDRFGRLVVDLETLDGQSVAVVLRERGVLQSWDYDGGAPKPEWCASRPSSLAAR